MYLVVKEMDVIRLHAEITREDMVREKASEGKKREI